MNQQSRDVTNQDDSASPLHFRVMTYNIHKGIGGVDRRYRPERIVNTIAHYQPDIVLLQEVDDGAARSRHHCQVKYLAEALGYEHQAFQANVKLRQGAYGNAILSRFPLLEVHDIDLTIPLKKRRRALVARCRLRSGNHTRTLWVTNFHLGLASFERVMQLRRFLAHDKIAHMHHDTPSIVGGDYNDVWGTLGRKLLEPQGFTPAVGNVKTFPAMMPMRPLDRIYFRGGLELITSFAGHIQEARAASDHLPLIAEFVAQLSLD